MPNKLTKTNKYMIELIRNLKRISRKEKVALWRRIARELEKSERKKTEINLFQIARVTKENDTIIVPGKVLGSGAINHKVNIAAFRFSGSAGKKVNAMSIEELMKKNPKAKGVRIIC